VHEAVKLRRTHAVPFLEDAINAAWRLEQLSVTLATDPERFVRFLAARRLERDLDASLGIRTSPLSFLPPVSRMGDAQPSQPLGYAALRAIEADLSRRPLPESFVDLGCGRGRALAYLSRLPFAAMLGVEVDAAMVTAARENLRAVSPRWRQARDVVVQEGDATELVHEWRGSAVLLFNPFGAASLWMVLSRMRARLAVLGDARMDVYYAAPVHHRVFREILPEAAVRSLPGTDPVVYHYRVEAPFL
jgi:SAM-dependent methyltransferase